MSKLLAIHGIGQEYSGGHTLKSHWLNAIRDGLHEVSDAVLGESDLTVVGFGAEFRPQGERGIGEVNLATMAPIERDLVAAFWAEAVALSRKNTAREEDESPTIQGPDDTGRARVPEFVQTALRQLANTRFFGALNGATAVTKLVRQVYLFLHDETIKEAILARVAEAVDSDTRIIVAHSLGSIVAYEALCRNPQWPVQGLITLGSPLGISPMIFDALTPRPVAGRAIWPSGVKRWVNVADQGDIVALEKKLAQRFGAVEDEPVYNGWHSHDAIRYLNARTTGLALSSMLREFT